MNNLKLLSLIKEWEFYETSILYKQEISNQIDVQFMMDVNAMLDINPELKEIYQHKEQLWNEGQLDIIEADPYKDRLDDVIDIFDDNGDIKIESTLKDNDLKNLYRKIVKITHPDKVKNKMLNNIYIISTRYYNDFNINGLITICLKLEIDFNEELFEIENAKKVISDLKSKSDFLESTYSWKWNDAKTKNEKDQLVLDFIKRKIDISV